MIRVEPLGCEALLLVLADEPTPELPGRIQQLAQRLSEALGPRLRDWVAGWNTLLLQYDLYLVDPQQLMEQVQPLLSAWERETDPIRPSQRWHELPIRYDGEDLAFVAQSCGLTVAEVVQIHSGTGYQVGAMGFAPGFAYLGVLDARLSLPRRATPRTHVPAGSVAIAERQTAIYPQASPGGWHVIGHCPQILFDPQQEPPCPLALGDWVRFVALS